MHALAAVQSSTHRDKVKVLDGQGPLGHDNGTLERGAVQRSTNAR